MISQENLEYMINATYEDKIENIEKILKEEFKTHNLNWKKVSFNAAYSSKKLDFISYYEDKIFFTKYKGFSIIVVFQKNNTKFYRQENFYEIFINGKHLTMCYDMEAVVEELIEYVLYKRQIEEEKRLDEIAMESKEYLYNLFSLNHSIETELKSFSVLPNSLQKKIKEKACYHKDYKKAILYYFNAWKVGHFI